MHVAIKERAHVLVGRRNVMFVQDADNNSRIRHASNLDVVQIIIDTETLFEGAFECSNARATRMDQCAVDIKKEETLSDHGSSAADCGLSLHFSSGALPARPLLSDLILRAPHLQNRQFGLGTCWGIDRRSTLK